MRRVYADTLATTPVKYSYADWAYFLKLLGEDEQDASIHKTASTVVEEEGPSAEAGARQRALDSSGQEASYEATGKQGSGQKPNKEKWSWIGVRSPLMGDQEEAEWLLEKFFQRLEESLRGEGMEKEANIKKETVKRDPSRDGHEEASKEDGSSEDTITRGESNGGEDKH